MQLDEKTGAAIVAAGVLISVIGGLWLLVRGFRQSVWWGLAVLLLPAVGPLAFLVRHFRKAVGPVLLMVLGGLVVGVPVMVNVINGDAVVTDAKTEEKTENGETVTHLTLTGARREEYGKLSRVPNLTQLQWANADVTDKDVEVIKTLKNLKKLDLNGTQITDDTLDVIGRMNTLQSLWLARTKITDDGFREEILPLSNLDELDLTGTAVTAKTAREWKAAKPGRKLVR